LKVGAKKSSKNCSSLKTVKCIERRLANSMFWHFWNDGKYYATKDNVEVDCPIPIGWFFVHSAFKKRECSDWNVGPN